VKCTILHSSLSPYETAKTCYKIVIDMLKDTKEVTESNFKTMNYHVSIPQVE